MSPSRSLRRRLVACAAALAAAFTVAPVAHAQGAPVVNQGDFIRVETVFGWRECTVGYIDHGKRQAITAGHCVTLPGMPARNHRGELVGIVASPPLDISPGQNDFARIALVGSAPGNNKFSGNAVIHPNSVRPGERVCQVGAASRRVSCGTIYAVRGSAIFTNDTQGMIPGDSGGPAWIPGRGFIGVNSLVGPVGGNVMSAPFFYFGPDLLWPYSLDLRRPVGPGNIIGSS